MPNALPTVPTAAVEETPEMDTETDKPTDPTSVQGIAFGDQ